MVWGVVCGWESVIINKKCTKSWHDCRYVEIYLDQLMIKMILGDFDLGVYGSVVKIYDAYVMIGFTLTLSLISYLTKHKKINLIINKIYKYLYLLFIPVSIILYFLSDFIVNILFI